MLLTLVSVYAINMGDTLIFGKAYEKVGLNMNRERFLAMAVPEFSPNETGVYLRMEFEGKF